VTRDEIPDPQNLQLRTYVNDEVRQSNSTAKMIWSVAEIVAFFSHFYTLQPGFLLETGTPGGTAWATDPEIGGKPFDRDDVVRKGYMQVGDVVRVEIEGIGSLSNPIVAAPPPQAA
jgi:2-keto-4-pentenoate hydratase/2-oxohepta-3-ene-1,7-dioic acid hydratase in catechol pathway